MDNSPRTFERLDWVGTWELNHAGGNGALTIHALDTAVIAGIPITTVKASYLDAEGRAHPVDGRLHPHRPGRLRVDIDVPDRPLACTLHHPLAPMT